MTLKVLVDMNLSPGWVDVLAAAGIEAVHWSTVGPGDASDTELMRWAAERDCIVLTSDLDFGAILAATRRGKPSVIQVRSATLAPAEIGKPVVAAIQRARRELVEGAVVSIDAARARVRILPLNR